jgi:predicted nucleic acid-binding protein
MRKDRTGGLEVILDTNALSAMIDEDEALESRLSSIPMLALPVIVLGEFRYGLRISQQRKRYEAWLDEHVPLFDVLTIDTATAEEYAQVRNELDALGKPIPANDMWIAALCRQYRMPIVTRDRHFSIVPKVEVVTW